jgi:hypothetical protein
MEEVSPGVFLPDVEITTDTGNSPSARKSAGKTFNGPELPKETNTFGFGSSNIRFHQSGLGALGIQGQIPT